MVELQKSCHCITSDAKFVPVFSYNISVFFSGGGFAPDASQNPAQFRNKLRPWARSHVSKECSSVLRLWRRRVKWCILLKRQDYACNCSCSTSEKIPREPTSVRWLWECIDSSDQTVPRANKFDSQAQHMRGTTVPLKIMLLCVCACVQFLTFINVKRQQCIMAATSPPICCFKLDCFGLLALMWLCTAARLALYILRVVKLPPPKNDVTRFCALSVCLFVSALHF